MHWTWLGAPASNSFDGHWYLINMHRCTSHVRGGRTIEEIGRCRKRECFQDEWIIESPFAYPRSLVPPIRVTIKDQDPYSKVPLFVPTFLNEGARKTRCVVASFRENEIFSSVVNARFVSRRLSSWYLICINSVVTVPGKINSLHYRYYARVCLLILLHPACRKDKNIFSTDNILIKATSMLINIKLKKICII